MTYAQSDFAWTSNSDATFRTWGAAVAALLAAAGLVKTSDTGQINWLAVTDPAVNVAGGYEVYRFDDALQATVPIFIKVEYGTASGNAANPQLWLTVGTATDGAGTISAAAGMDGSVTPRVAIGYTGGSGWPAASAVSRANLDDSEFYALLGLGASPTVDHGFFFWITRTRDTDGTPLGDGFLLTYGNGGIGNFSSGSVIVVTYQRHTFGASPTQPSQINGGGPILGASGWWSQTLAENGLHDGVQHLIPCCTGLMHRLYGISKLLLGCYGADFPAASEVEADHYGAPHSWYAIGRTLAGGNIAGNSNGPDGILVRID